MFLGEEPPVGLENKYKIVSFEYILRLKTNVCLNCGECFVGGVNPPLGSGAWACPNVIFLSI